MLGIEYNYSEIYYKYIINNVGIVLAEQNINAINLIIN